MQPQPALLWSPLGSWPSGGWETGPTYRMNILLIWGQMWPSLDTSGSSQVLSVTSQSEGTAFSTQHMLDGWRYGSHSQPPAQGYFHACWSGVALSFPWHQHPVSVTQMPTRGRALWEKVERPSQVWNICLLNGHVVKLSETGSSHKIGGGGNTFELGAADSYNTVDPTVPISKFN